jgi:hypothetical protein
LKSNGKVDVECDRLLDEKDFKRIRALKRRRLEDREIKEMNKDGGEQPANHQPEFDILKYAKKQRMIQNFKSNPDNIEAFQGVDLDELDEEELIDLISDEEMMDSGDEPDSDDEGEDEGEDGEELESGDEMEEEDIDPEE